ncbi:hypothetical protein Glove_212g40 [Diversispora epigaea]|uniref:Uncharacterized protein n=1 Tax=Diversispora epigaea TaxID=1348612 RepID=A0A397ISG1_9GLOM|nr:hypothetical protein Glove_212g40 [Diversispora epigaea]
MMEGNPGLWIIELSSFNKDLLLSLNLQTFGVTTRKSNNNKLVREGIAITTAAGNDDESDQGVAALLSKTNVSFTSREITNATKDIVHSKRVKPYLIKRFCNSSSLSSKF